MGKKVFAFDVGLKSLGVAVNIDGDIKQAKSLLIHETAGCTKEQTIRRRAYRTRRAHKEREKRLEEFWLENVGKEGFLQRKSFKRVNGEWEKTAADERLEKEFPGRDEGEITYASSLLRIRLLEGEKLEKWQIYKALHASIQRRGYDNDVPWKNREAQKKNNNSKKEENRKEKKKNDNSEKEKNPEEEAINYVKELTKKIKDEKYHYPCYLDAYKMGLWNDKNGIIAIRQNEKYKREKSNYTAPRIYVEKELKDLLKAAAKQIPQLKPQIKGDKLNHLLWGEKEKGSLSDKYPSEKKIGGLLAQKYPRFDNRIVSKCCLINRLNVCKSSKQLAIEVGFLMRLCNFRYESITQSNKKEESSLSREHIKSIFNKCQENWEKKNTGKYDAAEYAKCFKMTKTQLGKEIKKIDDKNELKVGHTEIEVSKSDGRSRYSQPALYILKKLILSEQKPIELYKTLQEKIATAKEKEPQSKFGYQLYDEVPYRYQEDDFWFLEKIKNKIYTPDMPLTQKYGFDSNDPKDKKAQRVISSCNWPIVRHRLGVFYQELKNLDEEHGKPDAVHIEFVREHFISNKKKEKYIQQSKEGKKKHEEAVKALKALPEYKSSNISQDDIKKYRLLKEQNDECLYTGERLCIGKLRDYEIDHIFPKEDGGPDAFYNIVLTTRDTNGEQKGKGKRLPCECDFIVKDWSSYRERIIKNKKIDKKKKSILLASIKVEAEELIEKYTPLHATSYIARLARDIVCIIFFDEQLMAKDENQKVFVFSGAATSRIAKKYELYRALGNGQLIYKKDRDDDRHHALDAMIISYLRQYTTDKDKIKFFNLPKGKDNYEYFSQKLEAVYPYYITRTKPALTEEPYQAWSEENLKKIKKNKKIREKRKLDEKKHLHNLSKDPDERGQWYQNKRKEGEGVFQHGYLFYFEETPGKAVKQFKHKTVHSYNSPRQIEKMLERKGYEIHHLFHSKQAIQINQQKKQISATQLGRKLPRVEYSLYKIKKINKGKDWDGESILCNLENEEMIRIKSEHLHKINIINNISAKQSFTLKEYPIKTKDAEDKQLNGDFQIEILGKHKSIIDIDNDEEYLIDNFDKLISYLYKEYVDEDKLDEMLKKGDIIQLGQFLPYIKDGTYTIKKESDTYSLEKAEYNKEVRLPILIKLHLINKYLVNKEPFELNNYPNDEEAQLTGSFIVSKISWNKDSATIKDSNNNEYHIDLKCLIIELYKNQTEEEKQCLLEKKTIDIDNTYLPSDKNYLPNKYSAKKDNLSKQKIKAGRYLLKNFDSDGKRIIITSQNGTDYRLSSKILEYAEPIPKHA